MRTARVTFHDGNTVTTRINGTTAEILSYYLGRWFNLGPVEDHMAKAVAVEFLDDHQAEAPAVARDADGIPLHFPEADPLTIE